MLHRLSQQNNCSSLLEVIHRYGEHIRTYDELVVLLQDGFCKVRFNHKENKYDVLVDEFHLKSHHKIEEFLRNGV